MKLSNERIMNAMTSCIREVFEKSMFMDLYEESRKYELILENKYYWVGEIAFKGDLEGVILLYCCKNVVENTASEFLGIEKQESDFDLKDGFNELTNIVAGNILADLSNENLTFSQGLPKTFNFTDFEYKKHEKSSAFSLEFSYDEEKIAVQIILFREILTEM